jgi:hypothetical protein
MIRSYFFCYTIFGKILNSWYSGKNPEDLATLIETYNWRRHMTNWCISVLWQASLVCLSSLYYWHQTHNRNIWAKRRPKWRQQRCKSKNIFCVECRKKQITFWVMLQTSHALCFNASLNRKKPTIDALLSRYSLIT